MHPPAALKANEEYVRSCQPGLDRREASSRRRRKHFVEQGGCLRCAYRKQLEGDFLCRRQCREDRASGVTGGIRDTPKVLLTF